MMADKPKHLTEMCRLPNTPSNTLANVPGHACTLGPNFFRPNSQTAISSLVFSLRTLSTRSKNFQTIPASTPPAANCPGGELMSFVMVVRASGIGSLAHRSSCHTMDWRHRPTFVIEGRLDLFTGNRRKAFPHSVIREFQKPALIHRYRSEEHTSELQSPMYLVCRL